MFFLPGARRQSTTLVLSSFSVSAVWLWCGNLSPALAEPPLSPVHSTAVITNRSAAVSSLGAPKITLDDVRFESDGSGFLAGLPFLTIRLNGDRIEIGEWRMQPPMKTAVTWSGASTVLRYPPTKPTAPFYTGPASEAQFVHERIAGVDTLKDRSGKTLWSNAAELSSPDLVLETSDSGQASLKGKDGALLWSGTLPVGQSATRSSSSSSSSQRGEIYNINAFGAHLVGVSGAFTLTDDKKRVLWTGTLPVRPVILLRRGRSFSLTAPRQSASGFDMTTELSFAVEKGEVTVEDTSGSVVGTRPIELLKVFRKTTMMNNNEDRVVFGQAPSPRYLLPRPVVTTGAGIRYTYKDSGGKTVGRGTINENRGLRLSESSASSSFAGGAKLLP